MNNQKLLKFVDKSRKGFIRTLLIIPVFIAEIILYRRLWVKTFLKEMIRIPEILEFFNNNEFELRFGTLKKLDVVPDHLLTESFDYIKAEIQKIYVNNIYTIVNKSPFNICDNILVMFTNIRSESVNTPTGIVQSPVFEIVVEYERLGNVKYWMKRAIKQLTFLILSAIVIGIMFVALKLIVL